MRISQLAQRCGVPATTLRFYEGAGLLPADRTGRCDLKCGFLTPAERAGAVATLAAAAEQQCCSFFDFRLHLDGQALHLDVRAPVDGAALLAELFGDENAAG
jgi:hypothetical protein